MDMWSFLPPPDGAIKFISNVNEINVNVQFGELYILPSGAAAASGSGSGKACTAENRHITARRTIWKKVVLLHDEQGFKYKIFTATSTY